MRGSRLIPILVTSSLIFTSIAYACSGLRLSMEMNFASTASSDEFSNGSEVRAAITSMISADLFATKCFLS